MIVELGERSKRFVFIPSLRISVGASSCGIRPHIPVVLTFPLQRIEVPRRFIVPAKRLSRATRTVEVPS